MLLDHVNGRQHKTLPKQPSTQTLIDTQRAYAPASQRVSANPSLALTTSDMLGLQRTIGNQAIQRLVPSAIRQSPHRKPSPDPTAGITEQDVKYEVIAHDIGYNTVLSDAHRAMLQQWGYEAKWFASRDDQATGFFVGLIMPSNTAQGRKPILVFRGTETRIPEVGKDIAADLDPTAVGFKAFEQNKSHVKQLIKAAGGNVDVVGHSLGGALAQHAAVEFPSDINRVMTFQSPGISQNQADKFKTSKKRPSVTHHIAKGDIVDLAGEAHLDGPVYEHFPKNSPVLPKWLLEVLHFFPSDIQASVVTINAIATSLKGLGSHTMLLLSAPEFKGHHKALNIRYEDPITTEKRAVRHEKYPYPYKRLMPEAGRKGLGLKLEVELMKVRLWAEAAHKGAGMVSELQNKATDMLIKWMESLMTPGLGQADLYGH